MAAGAGGPGGGQDPAGQGAGQGQPSEEELRARLEEELRKVTVRDVLLQTVVSLVNLSGQRLGLTPDMRDLRDLDQARLGIEAVRALLPLVEQENPEQVRPVRDALAQLQMAYAQEAGAAGQPPSGEPTGEPEAERGRGPAEGAAEPPGQAPAPGQARRSSGRLWVPPGSVS
jgi:hypothetical protein